MAKSDERYCLQKLIDYDPRTRTETWKTTKWCDDNEDLLELLLAANYRIFDTVANVEIKRNVNINDWT